MFFQVDVAEKMLFSVVSKRQIGGRQIGKNKIREVETGSL